jgi:hypothetical protein
MAYKKESFQMTVGPCRLAFPTLFHPEQVKLNGVPKGDPIYSARLVFEPDCPVLARIDAEMRRIAEEAWPAPAQGETRARFPSSFWWPIQQGSQAYPNDAHAQGKVVINASSKAFEKSSDSSRDHAPDGVNQYHRKLPPPEVYTVVNHSGQMIPVSLPKDERFKVFSGCEAFVNVGFFTFQNSVNDGGIGVGLNIVYLTGRDVGRFDARVTAAAGLAGLPPDAFSFGPQAPVPLGVPGPEDFGFPGPAVAGPGAAPQGVFPAPGPGAAPQGVFPAPGPAVAPQGVFPAPGPAVAPQGVFPAPGPAVAPQGGFPAPGPAVAPQGGFPAPGPDPWANIPL